MPYVPTWKERLDEARPYLMPAVAGLILAALAGWLVWHEWPARRARPRGVPAADDVDIAEKISQRAFDAGAAEDVVAAQLDRAIEKEREFLRLEPRANDRERTRLARLESARGTLRARVAATRSEALEAEARAVELAGQGALAAEKFREALRLCREANANAASPAQRNLPREARLAEAVESTEARPLHAAVEVALTLAAAAKAQEHWDEAIKASMEARLAQAELNQRYPDTRFAEVAALSRIDAEIAALKTTGAAATIAARERDGDKAAAAGRADEADGLYAVAAEAQSDVNEKFPGPRFVSREHADELAAKRDTVLSAALLARAAELDREATATLGRRQTAAAAEKISLAAALFEKVVAEFPRSRSLEAGLRSKLAYLASRRGDLGALQGQVDVRLAPLPGGRGSRMLKTEVSQELYGRVMGENPSRHTGPALPVDLVSWDDAQEFCRRLAWLLGAPVRLPTEAKFRAALGEGALAQGTWTADSSGGHSHEAGQSQPSAAGFYDLAGNLAEWLQPPAGAGETAPVAGGSYLDAAGALRPLPVVPVEKRQRARHIGFRVVVEPTE